MCFSFEADLAAAAVLTPLAIATIRAAPSRRELPLAALPAIFAAHQFIEAFVWLGLDDRVSHGVQQAAIVAYLFIAQVLLPAFVPIAVMLCEPAAGRRKLMRVPLALGILTAAWFAVNLITNTLSVHESEHTLIYATDVQIGVIVTATYVIATCGTALLSTRKYLLAFGIANLIGLSIAAVVRYEAVTSVWCIYAAFASVLLLLHMRASEPAASTGNTDDRASPALAG